MSIVADIVMAAWIPAVMVLFAAFQPRRAVIVSYLVGWLFLPFTTYELPLFPDYDKMSATSCGVLLGAILFDFQRFLSFRYRWFDIPITIFCIVPLFSSVANGLGVYDGVAGVIGTTIAWGLPYLVGRLYFNDAAGIRALAVAIFVGGLIYIPFCVFEIRMSPILHSLVYGVDSRGAGRHAFRYGGYRPAVFLDGGLQLGMWMTACSLIGFWLWRTKALTQLRGISMFWLAPLLIVVTVLCRSTGALALLLLGIGSLEFSRAMKVKAVLWCLLLIAPMYLVTRTNGRWDGSEVVQLASRISKDRAGSFQFRLKNENVLVEKALERPVFGWGSWGRNHVFDDFGNDLTITDGMWVIELGQHGLMGMVSLYAVFLLPLAKLLVRTPFGRLFSSALAPALSLGIIVVLYAIDCLPNAMPNPILMVAAGAVVGCTTSIFLTEMPPDNASTTSDSSDQSQAVQVPRRRLIAERF
jgi:hypothetical protein